MTKVKRQTVTEQGVQLVRAMILQGELRPGDAVKEAEMAKTIGVSRATIREVFRSLVSSGLLARHESTRILEVPRLSLAEVDAIYEARLLIEGAGIEAVVHVDDDAFGPLKESLGDMAAAIKARDAFAISQSDSRCHREVVALTGNAYLVDFHARLMSQLSLARVILHSDDSALNSALLSQHQDYVNYLTSRDVAGAKRQLEERMESSRQRIQDSAGVGKALLPD